jgi:hypothetical protein
MTRRSFTEAYPRLFEARKKWLCLGRIHLRPSAKSASSPLFDADQILTYSLRVAIRSQLS